MYFNKNLTEISVTVIFGIKLRISEGIMRKKHIHSGLFFLLILLFIVSSNLLAKVNEKGYGTITGAVIIDSGSGNVEDVQITARGELTFPDSNGNYTLEVYQGTYNVTAELEGYHTRTKERINVSSGQITHDINFRLYPEGEAPDWQPIGGTWYSMVVIATVSVDDEYIDDSGDNLVAAFGSYGDFYSEINDCRAIGIWQQYPLNVWYFAVEANQNGDEIYFKLYDSETNQIWEFDETVLFEENVTIGTPDDPYIIEAVTTETQEIPLDAGYNNVVFNVQPYNSTLYSVLGPLGDNIYMIQSQTQQATYFSGIWVGDLTNISAGEEYIIQMNNSDTLVVSGPPYNPTRETNYDQAIPAIFELGQNYPNPFNPETKIEYQLAKDTQVEISIYNIRGEKVRTLLNENRKAGYHSIIWNGTDHRNRELPSGIYLYRIKTDGYCTTKKMLLIK